MLRDDEITCTSGDATQRVGIEEIAALQITLSALVGRLVVVGRSSAVDLRFPAPLAGGAAAWLRSARRALANH